MSIDAACRIDTVIPVGVACDRSVGSQAVPAGRVA